MGISNEVYITKEGKIRAINPFGELVTDLLYTYQSDGKVVESNYKMGSNGTIKIIASEYDKTKNLIIDPYIGATYYGGNSLDEGLSITTDGNNNVLITGLTGSTNFPIQNPGGGAYFQSNIEGAEEIFILKFLLLSSNIVLLFRLYFYHYEKHLLLQGKFLIH